MAKKNRPKEDDFEMIEPDEFSYGGKPGEEFSHSALIMSILRKVNENGCKEMKEGYYNVKFDREGNAYKVWIEDSRNVFNESVKTLIMNMQRDFDEQAKNELEETDDELHKLFEKYYEMEKNDWKNANIRLKEQWSKKGYFRSGFLSPALPYKDDFINEEVRISRKKVDIILRLIKRLKDYAEISYEA